MSESSQDTPEFKPTLQQGDMLAGKYRVETVLAKGGFSYVYTCKWVDRGSTVVAKILHHEGVTKDHAAYARFVREARIAKAVDHPHHVRVYDYGKTDDGLPFLILERLHGKTLLDHFESQGRMDPKKLAIVLSQIADALESLHDKGIVHRDLKMPNVYLCDTLDGSTHIKIIDYGLAKIVTPSNPDVKNLTTKDIVVGTPGYLAPEALLGNPVTPQFDIYSLGVVAYEMFTGTRAYTGSLMEKALAQSAGNPEPPPPKLRGMKLWPVIKTMLARDPADRFQNVREIIDVLAEIDDPSAIRSRDDEPPEPEPASSAPSGPTPAVDASAKGGSPISQGPNPLIFIGVGVLLIIVIVVVMLAL